MQPANPDQALPQAGAATIDRDLHCATCSYNLRGLRGDARCPECNSPVEWALAGGDLYYANPDWVRRLASGAGWSAILLPWLWMPPAWPLWIWARMQLSARPPRGQAGPRIGVWRWSLMAWVIVLAAVALFVTMPSRATRSDEALAALALIFLHESLLSWGASAYAIAQRLHARGLRRCASLLSWIAIAGLLLHFGLLFDARFGLESLLLMVGGGVAMLMSAVAIPLSLLVAWLLWPPLAAAAAHARALRVVAWSWQRAEPGSGYNRAAA